ncbi:anti-sigma factor [Niabella beijingensis]|uniref:anti-sigma factor n=1 Tax=Niabella beijingensis TaxID=2872700 RepID=UPI001CC169A7|nr:anti-sigma factor [Niabella beijingensis]MBZ4188159.1 anti-sigma factor [Niabella beijingensis]
MNSKLEDFIHKNKAAFDDQEPSAALWKRLEKKMQESAPQPVRDQKPPASKVVKINWWKWAAAAMILITAGVLSRPYWRTSTSTAPPYYAHSGDSGQLQGERRDSNENATAGTEPGDEEEARRRNGSERNLQRNQTGTEPQPAANEVKEELFHYARLIEIKQKEIATLKNNYPELFEQFSEDLTTLNTSYTTLKHKYDEGLNSEQLLSAMIENLKLQTELLNRQLEITKKLKQQKNEATYKNI